MSHVGADGIGGSGVQPDDISVGEEDVIGAATMQLAQSGPSLVRGSEGDAPGPSLARGP